jgi:hypothetical protein
VKILNDPASLPDHLQDISVAHYRVAEGLVRDVRSAAHVLNPPCFDRLTANRAWTESGGIVGLASLGRKHEYDKSIP